MGEVEIISPARSTGAYWPHECPSCGGDLEEVLHRLRLEFIDLTRQANTHRSQHEAALKREERLKEQLAKAEAQIRQLKKQLFGRRNERGKKRPEGNGKEGGTGRKRGQQPGNPPPARRSHPALPVKNEIVEMGAEDLRCPICGKTGQPFFRDEVTEIKEIQVSAHIRRITRRCYEAGCTCGGLPGIMMGPVVGALFPGSQLGVSVWMEILLAKYRHGEPIHRLLDRWEDLGLSLPAGTIHSNLPRVGELFAPLAELVAKRNRQEEHWHIDETGWLVFAEMPGKVGYRWWLWVFVTEDTVVFKLAPSRGAQVIRDHLGESPAGIASVDRYSGYKAVALRALCFLLAYCWAHVRRDFLNVQAEWPELMAWSRTWLDRISDLYHANNQRREVDATSQTFRDADAEVRRRVKGMRKALSAELGRSDLHPASEKVLRSLDEHWPGLILFVTHPWIPMDNNTAERALRPAVVGRKNFWGSGSLATARLQADLGTVFFTLERNGINLRSWLHEYLSDCALSGGRAPESLERYLPWSATQASLDRWQRGPPAGLGVDTVTAAS